MEQRQHTLTIGQLADVSGVRAKVIRYYEAIGVLPQPPRGANGYRRYGSADVNRLQLLRSLRLLGVPLADAKALLNDAATARCVEIQQGVLALITERLHAIDREIQELHHVRETITEVQHTMTLCTSTTPSEAFSVCQDMRCIGLTTIATEDCACENLCQQCAM